MWHYSIFIRVFANIVHSVTRAHVCQFVEIHACTLNLYHAFTCVFIKITFDWNAYRRCDYNIRCLNKRISNNQVFFDKILLILFRKCIHMHQKKHASNFEYCNDICKIIDARFLEIRRESAIK